MLSALCHDAIESKEMIFVFTTQQSRAAETSFGISNNTVLGEEGDKSHTPQEVGTVWKTIDY